MQWKIFFCSVLSLAPLLTVAQGPNPKAVSDGKKIAMREVADVPNGTESNPPILDSLAPKAMPFAMSGNSKTVGADSKLDKSKLKTTIGDI